MIHPKPYLLYCLFILALSTNMAFGQKENYRVNKEQLFYTNVPAHDYDIILARPTNSSITVSILSYKNAIAYIEYFKYIENKTVTDSFNLLANEPFEYILNGLEPNSRYSYHLQYKPDGTFSFIKSHEYYFQTERSKSSEYTFTITADSHLDQNTDTLNYKTSMMNVASDSADFNIDLGDTFMTDKYRNNYKDAINQYIAQRYYFGLLDCPLFLVLGNHDGESGQKLTGNDDNMTVWANKERKKYFPNPVPDGFYTGNEEQSPPLGQPQDYYSWEWGNSLFIVLDPFLYTTNSGGRTPWSRSLGIKQYNWLKSTLENSKATFKFVFIHHLVGGADIKGKSRGGVEVAGFYEWGGKNTDGSDGFNSNRPGWGMPIHDLLVKNKVTAVFHGHDHIYVKQELDGIIYQCLPQPGAKKNDNINSASEYGYHNGTIMNGPGYLRVKVDKSTVTVDYVNTNAKNKSLNKSIKDSYIINH
ncbi:MAG: metallophosphoesterase [Flavobacteriaceae bacterium]|nr:metallophosphoesterase [Flavobacteriaceae bacterium]